MFDQYQGNINYSKLTVTCSKLARMQLRREHQNLQEFHNNYDDIEVALGGPTRSRDTGMFNCFRVICATSCIATSDNKSINDSLPDYETACKMLNEEPKISSSWHTDGGPVRKRLFFHMYHFYDILPCHQLIKTNFVGLRSGFITAETKIKKKVYFLLGSTCLPFLGGIVIKSLNRVSQARPPNRLIPRILQKRWSCKW